MLVAIRPIFRCPGCTENPIKLPVINPETFPEVNDRLFDPAEKLLPDLGVIKVRDPESGSSFWIDTSNRAEMEKLKTQINSDFDAFNKQAKKIGFDIISVSTNGDFVDPLISLFRKRDKR